MSGRDSATAKRLTPTIDFKRVPRQALIDAMRNSSIGATNKSCQLKSDLVSDVRLWLRTCTDARRITAFLGHVETETAYQNGKKVKT